MSPRFASIFHWISKKWHRARCLDEMPICRGIAFEPTDHFLTSFPRSGNTWFRHLVKETLVVLCPEIPRPADLQDIIPSIHRPLTGSTDARTWGLPYRLFKSHNLGSLSHYRVVYIFRDAADSLVSYYHRIHRNAILKGREPPDETLEAFCRRTLSDWCGQIELATARAASAPASTHLLSYEQLQTNPVQTLSAALRFLQLFPSATQVEQAVAACNFAQLSAKEGARRPVIAQKEFFRKGRVGGGREELTSEFLADLDAVAQPLYRRATLRTSAT